MLHTKNTSLVIIPRQEADGLVAQDVGGEVDVSPEDLDTPVRHPFHPSRLRARDPRSGLHYGDRLDRVTAHIHHVQNNQIIMYFTL